MPKIASSVGIGAKAVTEAALKTLKAPFAK